MSFFLPKSALLCKFFILFNSTIKTTISLSFSFQTLDLFLARFPLLLPFFYHTISGTSGRNCLLFPPPLLSGCNTSSVTHLFRGMTQTMSRPGGLRRSSHPLFHVASLLLSLVSTLLFTRTGGLLSHKSSQTHRSLLYSVRNLCPLVELVESSFAFDTTVQHSVKLLHF